MNDNIMDILDGTINKNMEINQNALEKLIYTTCSQKDLDTYVKGINFNNYSFPMAYSMAEKMVMVNPYKISKFLEEIRPLISMNDMIEERHQDIQLKLHLEQMILHEIEHVHQNKMISEKECNIEARLVSLNCHMLSITYHPMIAKIANINPQFGEILKENYLLETNLQNKHGSNMPIERLAENHAVKDIISYLSNATIDYSDIIIVFSGYQISALLSGYDFTLGIPSPTERYIDDFKQVNLIMGNKHFTKKFSYLLNEAKSDVLERRISLGLDITKDEYTKVKKMIA